MADIDVAGDLAQINSQLEQLVAQANELNTHRRFSCSVEQCECSKESARTVYT